MLLLYALFTVIACIFADQDKYWSLSAKRVVGKKTIKNSLIKRDSDDKFVSLKLIDEATFYMAEIAVGADNQKVGVLVDTGSSDFWIVGTNNTLCESGTTGSLKSSKGRSLTSILAYGDDDYNVASTDIQGKNSVQQINCSQYGTFDESTSKTFKSNYTTFSITYDDNTFAKGTWGQDTVSFGDLSISNTNIAICDYTDNAQGVLGIGLAGLETTKVIGGGYTYQNLPLKLVDDGIIKKAAYSVFLDDSSNSEILFGAIDSSKFTGDLISLPIVNALYGSNIPNPIQLTVTVNDLKYVSESDSMFAEIGSGAIAALLDTGTTLSYFPKSIVNSLISLFGLNYSSSLGYYISDCSIGDHAVLRFNFQGLDLDIPFSNFLINLYNQDDSVSTKCAFGILSSSNERYMTLGQSFLSSVYMIADLDDMNIALAKGANNGGTSEINLIESDIPQAKQPQYSTTYGARYNSFTINATPTMVSSDIATTSPTSSSESSSLLTYISNNSVLSLSTSTFSIISSSSSTYSSSSLFSESFLSTSTFSTSSAFSTLSSFTSISSNSQPLMGSSLLSSSNLIVSSTLTYSISSGSSTMKSSTNLAFKTSATSQSFSTAAPSSHSASSSTVSTVSSSKHKNDGTRIAVNSVITLLWMILIVF